MNVAGVTAARQARGTLLLRFDSELARNSVEDALPLSALGVAASLLLAREALFP